MALLSRLVARGCGCLRRLMEADTGCREGGIRLLLQVEFLCHPESRTPAPGIVLHLLRRWHQRLPRQESEAGASATGALQELRGTDTAPRRLGEELFHLPIFQGMKRYNADTTARAQSRNRLRERLA